MSEVNDPIIQLLEEYLSGEMEDARREELTAWLDKKEENRLFFERLIQDGAWKQRWRQWEKIDTETAIRHFDRCTRLDYGKRAYKRWVAAVAVAVLLLLAVGFSLRRLMNRTEVAPVLVENILPGNDKAILILANGEKIKLENNDSLQVDLGVGCQLVNKDNQLVYQGEETEELQYNELQIPRGGEYQVKLADGTIVRLNSGSSLRYPVTFGKEKREVVLKGEAYFEVAKNEKAPFEVITGEREIVVLGTKFNISSYLDAPNWSVTLVEGKVSVLDSGKLYVLYPSEQYIVDNRTGKVEVKQVDVALHISWLNGKLYFKASRLEDIIRELERWYDFTFIYQEEDIKDLKFRAVINKDRSLKETLSLLERTKVIRFEIKDHVITIRKNSFITNQ